MKATLFIPGQKAKVLTQDLITVLRPSRQPVPGIPAEKILTAHAPAAAFVLGVPTIGLQSMCAGENYRVYSGSTGTARNEEAEALWAQILAGLPESEVKPCELYGAVLILYSN